MTDAGGRATRVVTLVSLGVIVVALAVGAFFAGAMLRPAAATRADPPAAAPAAATATPTPSPTASASSAPPTEGPVAWDALRGGECVVDFESAWQQTYELVPCDEEHEAQATRLVRLKDDSYPGEADLIDRLSVTCADDGTLRLDEAARYDDIRIAYSYPTEEDWQKGARTATCFVDRDGAGTLEGSLAAED